VGVPLGVLLLSLLAACSRSLEPLRFEGPTMGTRYHITVPVLPPGSDRQALQSDIDEVLARVDMAMSTWRPDSEVSRLNALPVGEWLPISEEFHEVLRESIEIHAFSEGSFDVTVAPLLAAWGFGPRGQGPRVPDEAELDALALRLGSSALELGSAPHRVRKIAQREVELSAIAPGYAVDLIARRFIARGVEHFMIEVGGELRTAGRNPEGALWRIGIERPDAPPGTPQITLMLDGQSVSTSGDYREFFEVDGRRYSHTLDPRSLRPVDHGLASVTVLAPDCMRADALSTALMVLGPEQGLVLAEREGIPVYMLIRTEGGLQSRSTTHFSPYLEASAAE
jgi:thiamine biosynthesis lipoprotein